MARSTHYQVPSERGRLRAMALAVFVHLALLAMLWIGVRWQNEIPVAVEAEIWDPEMRESAPQPRPAVAKPVPKTPAPEPKPTPRPAPKTPAPEVTKKEVPTVDPDIALKQEKKRKELEKQREAEQLAARKRETDKQEADKRAEEQKRREADKRETEKQEATRKKQQAAEEERRQQEQAQEKTAKEKAKKEKVAKEKTEREKAEKEKVAKEKAAKEQAVKKAEADKRHAENLERLQAQAGTGGIGEAAKSQGGRADSDYSRRVGAKIKSNTIFNVPPGLSENPAVEYVIDLLPDGSVRGIRKQRSSGMPGFDEAVARAIERSQPFPPDKNGQVPSSLILSHEPKDQ